MNFMLLLFMLGEVFILAIITAMLKIQTVHGTVWMILQYIK